MLHYAFLSWQPQSLSAGWGRLMWRVTVHVTCQSYKVAEVNDSLQFILWEIWGLRGVDFISNAVLCETFRLYLGRGHISAFKKVVLIDFVIWPKLESEVAGLKSVFRVTMLCLQSTNFAQKLPYQVLILSLYVNPHRLDHDEIKALWGPHHFLNWVTNKH